MMCRMNERGQNLYKDVYVKTSEACDIFTNNVIFLPHTKQKSFSFFFSRKKFLFKYNGNETLSHEENRTGQKININLL